MIHHEIFDSPGALPADRPYFEIMEAVQVPLLVHRGGVALFANQAMERLTGVPRGEVIGQPFYLIAHPDMRAMLQERGKARLEGGDVPAKYELRLHTSDPRRQCWVEVVASLTPLNGMPTIIATFFDLTERKLAIARESYLRQMMGQIIDGDPVPTFVLDAGHKVIYWNKACATITGFPAAGMLGTKRQWAAFYPAERPVMADLVLDGTLEAGIESHYRGKFRRSEVADGAFEAEDFFPQFGARGCWLYFTAAPVRDANGRVVAAIETLQDVTARHDAEQTLRDYQAHLEQLVEERTAQLSQANDQLVQSEKLASIGQLAAGVAHEINNPIGYVHSNIGALEGYISDLFDILSLYEAVEPALADAPKLAELRARKAAVDLEFLKEDIPMLMRESREGITRVKKIVQDLKDFSHVDSNLEWQLADLHKGIDSTINVVNNEIKYKADVVKAYGDLPPVECLPSQLNQVFMNLLVNAAHAMGDARGTITIRTGQAGDTVWLEFADTGSGIPPAIVDRIFDPFFTTKPVGKGTGLGLSLAYGIIQKHNGRITVQSKPGEGTTFRIELPVVHVETAEPGTPA